MTATGCGTGSAGTGGMDGGVSQLPLGEFTVRADGTGGFSLVSGHRVLLASAGAPVEALTFQEQSRMNFGIWTFDRTDVRSVRPQGRATLTADGSAVVLTTVGEAGRSTLRFSRLSPGEVTVVATVVPAMPVGDPDGGVSGAATTVHFACTPDAHFLGFGEQYNNLDHRGRQFPLWVSEQGIGRDPAHHTLFSGDHATTYYPVPFFLDPRGMGMAVDTPARVQVDLCTSNPAEYTLEAAQPGPVTLHVYAGPTPADVLRDWTGGLQGRTAEPPGWAVEGVWLGVQGGSDAVRAAVARARAAGIPVAAVWAQDWLGQRDFGAGNQGVRYRWSVDPTLYPDLAGLITELHGQGVRFLGYFNPFLVPEQDLYAPAVAGGYAVRTAGGLPYTVQISVLAGGMVDLSRPEAVQWYQGYANRAMDLGMDGWMQDFGEWLPTDALLYDGSDPRQSHDLYPALWHGAARAVLEARRPGGDWVMFTRSGWLGAARSQQVVWAGDQQADWDPDDGLPTVIPAMVSLGLVGVGFATHDVAGFSGGPSTRELYQRWVELGAFSPVFRTHQGLMAAANWSWDRDAETLAHMARFARVHHALAPALEALGTVHQQTGMPVVRALGVMFPQDTAGYGLLDEYMLGDDLLVAPVVTQGAVSRTVHLPPGVWYDVWDPSRTWTGPMDITVDAPIGRPPVFSHTPRSDLAAIR